MSVSWKRSLLIVEDEPMVLRMLTSFAEKDPHLDVRSVMNLESAVESVQAEPADVVLMDMYIPGVGLEDPAEGIRVIHSLQPNAAIVAFSGDIDLAPQAKAAGAQVFINKPPQLSEMLTAIELACTMKDVSLHTAGLVESGSGIHRLPKIV